MHRSHEKHTGVTYSHIRFIKILVLLFALVILSITDLSAQKSRNITIYGKVVDGNDKPVAGAAIFIDNIKTDVVTDKNGSYRIRVKPGAAEILVLSLFGDASEEKIGGRSEINFVLRERTGEQPSVQKVQEAPKALNIKDSAVPVYQDIYDMIRGRVPGVEVSGKSIKIRGTHSLNVSTEPLFVVDGVITQDIDGIAPETVSSIEVLKGPDATAYGTRGANGVILIKRRTGKE